MALTAVGFTGSVDQASFSRLNNLGDGIVGSNPGDAALRVDRVVGQDRRVSIQPGSARVPGVRATESAVQSYTFPANASGFARYDWLVMRFDWGADPGTVTFIHVQGTPAAAPARPALTQTAGTRWEVPLALVRIDAGVGALPADAVEDARYWDRDGVAVQLTEADINPPVRAGRLFYIVGTGALLVGDGAAYDTVAGALQSLALTLPSTWESFGGGYGPPVADVDVNEVVHLRGLLRRIGVAFTFDSAGDGPIATVPSAARPIAVRRALLAASSVGPIRLDVWPTGEVMIFKHDGSVTFPLNGFVSLDGISYRR